MLTPVIFQSFTRSFWEALVAQAAQDSMQGVLEYVKAHLPGHHEAATGPRLAFRQLQLVRTVAEREARRLDLSEGQAGLLLADALVGVLAGPPVS